VITPEQQFRNQKVLLVIQVPVGKKILMKRNLEEFKWLTINKNHWRNNGINIEWNDSDNDETYSWTPEVEYIMTENGLERTNKDFRRDEDEQNRNASPDSIQKKNPNGDYRYHKPKTTRSLNAPAPENSPKDDESGESSESSATLALLTNLS
jgi:hypothetical protein